MKTTDIDLKKKFIEEFGGKEDEIRFFFAPGRVNLIGEHIDYNGGLVLPASLTIGITALVRLNNMERIRMVSLNDDKKIRVKIDKEIKYDREDDWGNYPKGVFHFLKKEGYILSGCDILYSSTLPEGAGLSSSAAIEVLTTYFMLNIMGVERIDRIRLAKFCQKVENEFIKVNCGIMDQFSVAMGKEDYAISLNCKTLKYKYVSLNLRDYRLVIMNTNKKRGLSDSKYNERRKECNHALQMVKAHEDVESLCEVTIDQMNKYISDPVFLKRSRHVITENQRVYDAINSLEKGDLLTFGSLMNASHVSLKNDYEVTGFELDTLVEEALKFKGCIGARMTGAGFGGCAIALVRAGMIDLFKYRIRKAYRAKTNLTPTFYESKIGYGVKELTELREKIT